jgi:paraquat-inducible protein B
MRAPSATLVGAFVLGALALVVAGVLFFGRGSFTEQRIPLVSFFYRSVAGLKVGAPVTFRGVRVGEVKAIGIRVNPETGSYIIQVDMELATGAVRLYGGDLPRADEKLIPTLVQRGLTAQLVVESFVTKMLDIDLDFRPGVKATRLGEATSAPEVPTVTGDWEGIAQKLQEVDIASTLNAVQRTLATMEGILNSPEVKQSIVELPRAMAAFRQTLSTIDREVISLSGTGRATLQTTSTDLHRTLAAVEQLAGTLNRESMTTLAEARNTLAEARGTFKSLGTTVEGANALLDPRGRTVTQIQHSIDDLAATAARLRRFTERVDRDPSVLVRGR